MTAPTVHSRNVASAPPKCVSRRHLLGTLGSGASLIASPFQPAIAAEAPAPQKRNRVSVRIPRAILPCGLNISKVVKGCWQLDGAHRGDPSTDRTSGAEAEVDFERFFASGVTTIDTADIYGPSEALVGQFLRLNPGLRDQVQILTKVSLAEEDMGSLSRNMLEYRVRASMRRMGVSRLDLVQLHWEDFRTKGYVDAAKWLADLQEEGIVGHVGLTNFDTPHMIEVLDAGVKIASNQVQYSVIDRRPELFMTDLCKKKGIAILPYGVLAGGFINSTFVDAPASKALLNTMSKAKYGTQLREQGGWTYMQDVLQALQGIAVKHEVGVSAVAIKWVLEQPCVPAVIIGARNARHVRELQEVFAKDFTLDEEDNLTIEAAYEGAKAQPQHDCFVWERGGPW